MSSEIEAEPTSTRERPGIGSTDERTADELLCKANSEQTPTLSVVMPTLNEEEGVGQCIQAIKRSVARISVPTEIVVSDSSTDKTPEIARNEGAIVVEPDEGGYGYAYRYAFEHARGEYIVIGDADTTYDFTELPKLLEPVRNGEASMCMGSRLDGEIKPGAMPPLHQYVGNPFLTAFLNVFYDAGVSDAHSGFRVISREALDELDLKTNGMEFASEMIMEAGARDLDIAERPIVYHEREGEATLESFRDGWRHVRFMLVNAPGYLFSIPGVSMMALGVVVMALCLTNTRIGAFGFGLHSMVAGSMFTIVGAQVGGFGVFATMSSDPIRAPSDPVTSMLTDRVQLEHGATAGLLVFALGAVYGVVMIARWITSDFGQLPILMADIVALTAIVLGVQIVFSSFFLSTVASATSE